MKRTFFVVILLLLLNINAYPVDFPLFNPPPNDYKLFKLNNEIKNQPQQTEKQIKAPSSNLSINGIFKSQGQYFALINHKVCKKGDTVNGYTIKSIENNKVVLVKNGEESTLILNSTPNIIFFSNDTVSDNDSKH